MTSLAATVLTVLERLADDVGQVLVQCAAPRDVDDLGAAADGQHGHVALVGGARQRELELVQGAFRRAQARVPIGAVDGGIDVGTAGQADAVDAIQEGVDRAEGQRRDDDRQPAGALDRLQVGEPERHLAPLRIALGRRRGHRRHAHLG